MNRSKKALVELRNHLARDERGRNLLDAVSRELTEQRHRIASLEESNRLLEERWHSLVQENCNAKVTISELRTTVETETKRTRAAEAREEILTERLRRIECENEVEDEVSLAPTTGMEQQFRTRLKWLSKEVRRRFKKIPPAVGERQIFDLDYLVRNFVYDEFAGLGMLMTLLAMVGFPAGVSAGFTVQDLKGWDMREVGHFMRWYSSWLASDATSEAIAKHFWGGGGKSPIVHERNAFTVNRAAEKFANVIVGDPCPQQDAK